MKHGTKPIDKAKIGDLVVSRDPKTGKTTLRKIVGIRVHQATTLLTLNFGDLTSAKKLDSASPSPFQGEGRGEVAVDSIRCTPEHPFYVPGQGFTAAIDLKVGDVIVTRNGPNVNIISIVTDTLKKAVPVYNLTIEGDHSYFLGTQTAGNGYITTGSAPILR